MAAPTVMERPAPEVLVPAPETFARLAALEAAHPTAITCYVRLEIQDRVATRYRIAARDVLHPFHDLPSGHTDREAVHRDLERLAAFLADSRHLPHSPGMVLFACESLDLFAMMPLPRVARTRAVLDVRPRVAEAAAVAPEFAPILLAAVDRTHARFFRVTVDDVEELTGLTLPATRGGKFHSDRADSPGWGEHDYHNRIREERHRHAAAVADRLADTRGQRPVARHRAGRPGARHQRAGAVPSRPPATAGALVGSPQPHRTSGAEDPGDQPRGARRGAGAPDDRARRRVRNGAGPRLGSVGCAGHAARARQRAGATATRARRPDGARVPLCHQRAADDVGGGVPG